MEVLDIGLKITIILPTTIVMAMIFMMMKILKCLRVMEDAYIGVLIPATPPLAIVQFIIVVTMIDMDLCLNIPSACTLAILEFIIVMIRQGDNGRGGYMSQDTSLSSSCNCGARVNVDGRGVYRSQTIHY